MIRPVRLLARSVFAGALVVVPGAMTVATRVALPVAHAVDNYDCTDSYLPCDGTTLDYLVGSVPYPDYVDNAPPPGDPVYDTPLSEPLDWEWDCQPWWGECYGSG